jgi:hypothetical protein
MGILSGYRFCEVTDKYLFGLSTSKLKTATLANVGSVVGWNFIVVSCIIILCLFGYSFLMGYNRNPGGMIALLFLNFAPFLGFAFSYNTLYGFGTAQFLPAMTLFGIHTGSRASQVVFIIAVSVLIVAFWFLGKYVRSIYARKYEIEF